MFLPCNVFVILLFRMSYSLKKVINYFGGGKYLFAKLPD
jgi:hypothetical protein